MTRLIGLTLGLAGLVAAVGAGAQRADLYSGAQRAIDTAARVQDRSAQAQDRAVQAQERAIQAQERVVQAQERGSTGAERAVRALDAATGARAGLGRQPFGARDLARDLLSPIELARRLVARSPETLEIVDRFAAVRQELVAIDPSPESLAALDRAGYRLVGDETVEGINLRIVTLRTPGGRPVTAALREALAIAPGTEFSANHLHLQSGASGGGEVEAQLAKSTPIAGRAVGLVDGGVGETGLLGKVFQQGFAAGAPRASAHGTAMASLVSAMDQLKSAAAGAPLLVADVYGSDAKGGNALALARALGWMTARKVPVVIVGLVGPSNPIVAAAVARAQARGVAIVAPVGNAGAAMPPLYPAAYPGVIAVTGVDRRNRALIEAGRGDHVDYAAPGADIRAAAPGGRLVKVRGTSFAAPLIGGRIWRAESPSEATAILDREAVDLGPKGKDPTFGRGLVCGHCR